MLLDVIRVGPPPAFQLLLAFENHEKRIFDLSPHLEIGVFRQIKDARRFRTAHIEGGTVASLSGIDIGTGRCMLNPPCCEHQMMTKQAGVCRYE